MNSTTDQIVLTYPERLSPSVRRSLYEDSLFEHVDALLGLALTRFGSPDSNRHPQFDWNRYVSLEQAALEWGPVDGAASGDPDTAWEKASEEADRFDRWIAAQALENRERFVYFMRRSVENTAFYAHFYRSEAPNPWKPLARILERGVLLARSDANDGEARQPTPLAFESLGSGRRTGRIEVAARYEAQQLVYDYLSKQAPGHDYAKNGDDLVRYLTTAFDPRVHSFDRMLRKETLQVEVLAPLKRVGVIGSTNDGYFVLNTPEDCDFSIRFHDGKLHAIKEVIKATAAKKSALEAVNGR